MSLDAMKQALEALERGETKLRYEAITALRAAIEQAQEPWVRTIKTWQQRCDEHPDHNGIVTDGMIQARMQEEIDELRAAIEQPRQWQGLTGDEVNEFAAGCHLGNSVQGAIRKAEAKLKEKNT